MADVRLVRDAEKYLNSIPKQLHNKFISEMLALGEDPMVGIPLVGALKGLYKLRFDFYGMSYRIIYEPVLQEDVVNILLLGPRQNIYKKMGRLKRRR